MTSKTSSRHAGQTRNTGELERTRIPPSRQLSGKYFLGSFAGEHVAGTEFVIGASLVALGVSTGDLLLGLLLGNLMAVLSWAWVCTPIATRSRMTLYWYIERLAGKRFAWIYNLLNGLIFAVISGAMITVSASAFRVVTGIPTQTGWYPESVSFVILALFVGAITVWLTLKGFKLIANFSTVCAPWMAVMFVASGIVSIGILLQLGEQQGVIGLSNVVDQFVWTGITPAGDPGISVWIIAAWAWGANMPQHLGMSDMSTLRFARKTSYGYFSAAGMYIGHFVAWLCSGLMGATAALLAQSQLIDMDPGGVAFRILGIMGLLAVVIAGWTTSIPCLYRAGLAFQSIFPRYSRTQVTLAVGSLTTVIACSPFVFNQWLNVLSYFIMLIAPIGGIIAAEHFILPRQGIRPFWREHQKNIDNVPAFVTWGMSVAVGVILLSLDAIHLFTLFIPVWLTSLIGYPLICFLMGVRRESKGDLHLAAYGPVNPEEIAGDKPPATVPVQRRNPWYYLALACLVVILAISVASYLSHRPLEFLDTFRWLIIAPTVVYFIAATKWMKGRRRVRRDVASHKQQWQKTAVSSDNTPHR